MARIDIIMPQMGESITEGTLSKWIKQVGDAVKRDEPIFEISTDKVDAEIPSPEAGVLAEVLVQQGQTVAVNTVVARIETEKGASIAAAPAPSATPAVAPPAATPAPAAAAPSRPVAPAPSRGPAAAPARAVDPAETMEERLRRRSTPLVRKIAAEHGIDITGVAGSGLAGRVTKNDIIGVIEGGAVMVPVPEAVAAPSRPAEPSRGPATPGTGYPAAEPWDGDTVEPWSRIRRLTAEHMVMSRRVSAHVQTLFEIDYSRVAQVRAKKKKEYAERGVNLTYLAFIARAIAQGLRKHPSLNAAVANDATIYRRDINLGIAVALDWGLIVPVIKQADELSLLGLAGHQRPGRAGAQQEAEPGRSPARHLHHHQSRYLRLARGVADHQSAAGGDPGRRLDREAAGRGHAPGWHRHDRAAAQGDAHDVVRSPRRRWRQRRPVPRRREADPGALPGRRGLRWAASSRSRG